MEFSEEFELICKLYNPDKTYKEYFYLVPQPESDLKFLRAVEPIESSEQESSEDILIAQFTSFQRYFHHLNQNKDASKSKKSIPYRYTYYPVYIDDSYIDFIRKKIIEDWNVNVLCEHILDFDSIRTWLAISNISIFSNNFLFFKIENESWREEAILEKKLRIDEKTYQSLSKFLSIFHSVELDKKMDFYSTDSNLQYYFFDRLILSNTILFIIDDSVIKWNFPVNNATIQKDSISYYIPLKSDWAPGNVSNHQLQSDRLKKFNPSKISENLFKLNTMKSLYWLNGISKSSKTSKKSLYHKFKKTNNSICSKYSDAVLEDVFNIIQNCLIKKAGEAISLRELENTISNTLAKKNLVLFGLSNVLTEIVNFLSLQDGYIQLTPYHFFDNIKKTVWKNLAKFTIVLEPIELEYLTNSVIELFQQEGSFYISELAEQLYSVYYELPYELHEAMICDVYDFFVEKGLIE